MSIIDQLFERVEKLDCRIRIASNLYADKLLNDVYREHLILEGNYYVIVITIDNYYQLIFSHNNITVAARQAYNRLEAYL